MAYIKIHLNPKYEINELYNIRRADGEELDLVFNKQGLVNIELYRRNYWVKPRWLYVISKKRITLPPGYEKYLIRLMAFVTVKNEDILFWLNPIQEVGKERYLVPDNPNFSIDKQGNVFDIVKKKFIPIIMPTKTSYIQYPCVKLQHKLYVLHRLLAKVFIKNIDHEQCYVVDHIDGNKCNYRLNNLRWCTPKQNVNYAYGQGLKTDNKPVLIRNIKTGEVKEFESTTKACEYIGRSRYNNKHVPLRKDLYHKGTNGYYEMKYADDKRDWNYPKLDDVAKLKLDNITYYKVTLPNGKIVQGNKNEVNLALFGENFLGTTEAISQRIKDKIPGADVTVYDRPRIQAKNVVTSEVLEAPTVIKLIELIKDVKLSKSTVNKYIHNQKEYNGYLFRFKPREEQDWINLGSNTDYVSKSQPVKIENMITGEIETFNSLRETAANLQVQRKHLKKYLNTGKLFRKTYLLSLVM